MEIRIINVTPLASRQIFQHAHREALIFDMGWTQEKADELHNRTVRGEAPPKQRLASAIVEAFWYIELAIRGLCLNLTVIGVEEFKSTLRAKFNRVVDLASDAGERMRLAPAQRQPRAQLRARDGYQISVSSPALGNAWAPRTLGALRLLLTEQLNVQPAGTVQQILVAVENGTVLAGSNERVEDTIRACGAAATAMETLLMATDGAKAHIDVSDVNALCDDVVRRLKTVMDRLDETDVAARLAQLEPGSPAAILAQRQPPGSGSAPAPVLRPSPTASNIYGGRAVGSGWGT